MLHRNKAARIDFPTTECTRRLQARAALVALAKQAAALQQSCLRVKIKFISGASEAWLRRVCARRVLGVTTAATAAIAYTLGELAEPVSRGSTACSRYVYIALPLLARRPERLELSRHCRPAQFVRPAFTMSSG